jgi:hypothetical protein
VKVTIAFVTLPIRSNGASVALTPFTVIDCTTNPLGVPPMRSSSAGNLVAVDEAAVARSRRHPLRQIVATVGRFDHTGIVADAARRDAGAIP